MSQIFFRYNIKTLSRREEGKRKKRGSTEKSLFMKFLLGSLRTKVAAAPFLRIRAASIISWNACVQPLGECDGFSSTRTLLGSKMRWRDI